MPSMNTPASGAPSATPAVRAEPYQPIASPRRSLDTSSATFSEAEDRTGAHSSPGRSESRLSVQVSVAKPIGNGECGHAHQQQDGRDRPVHGAVDAPPTTDAAHQKKNTMPISAWCPPVSRAATIPTSVPLRTMPAPAATAKTAATAGREPG